MAGRHTATRARILAQDSGREPILEPAQIEEWPELPWQEWHQTAETLHLWMQIVGKIRMALAPRTNHWWHVTFYLTSQGMTTSPIPYGNRLFQIDWDFIHHQLIISTHDGRQGYIPLQPMSVADFYDTVMECMTELEMPVRIWPYPTEMANGLPFKEDHQHFYYEAKYVTRFWKAMLQANRVLSIFRARFIGKVSPVHFFWGGYDLAVSRFSGQRAPRHDSVPNIPDSVVQAAYSHEVSSCGFWPGGPGLEEPIFYSYAYPMPAGFDKARIVPKEAYFHKTLGEYVLPYEAVRQASNPDQYLLAFLQSTYDAAANLGQWDRKALEATHAEI